MTPTHAEAIAEAAARLREAGIEDAHLEARGFFVELPSAPCGEASSRSPQVGPQVGGEICRGRCDARLGPPRRRNVSPASALVTERPLRKPSGAQRTSRERLQPGQQVPRRRTQPEIDALGSVLGEAVN